MNKNIIKDDKFYEELLQMYSVAHKNEIISKNIKRRVENLINRKAYNV